MDISFEFEYCNPAGGASVQDNKGNEEEEKRSPSTDDLSISKSGRERRRGKSRKIDRGIEQEEALKDEESISSKVPATRWDIDEKYNLLACIEPRYDAIMSSKSNHERHQIWIEILGEVGVNYELYFYT
jgi:hypothetical protein